MSGCHPLLVCTDRPELCPPECRPVVRNAGSNDTTTADEKGAGR